MYMMLAVLDGFFFVSFYPLDDNICLVFNIEVTKTNVNGYWTEMREACAWIISIYMHCH